MRIEYLLVLCATSIWPFHVATAKQHVLRIECIFDRTASPEGVKKTEHLIPEYTIDTTTKEAFMVGNAGMSKVIMIEGYLGFTLMEYLPTGAVQTTTIANGGYAIHSRHTLLSRGSSKPDAVPTQNYGTCR